MEIEVKIGLEIHQQLDTKKLFCECPSILRKEDPDYSIERELHVVAGETGGIDVAAKHEAEKARKFIYQGYNDNDCLVELDEEPPHQINEKALEIGIQVALLMNCEILPYTQIMRKTVIDGSNVSGFQRTLLLARNGYVETEEGRVGIAAVFLEEDAARIISKDKGKAVYRLDRLGIPLLEISTTPDIKSGKQAREAALKIGEILRACKVKRGIGTIRQDVNLSVNVDGRWGQRVEIKGVQEPKLIEKTIETETNRQKRLIKKEKSIAEVRKALPDGKTEFLRPMPGKARMYPETDLPILHIGREIINQAKKDLPKLKSELKDELKKHNLNEELVKLVVQENKLDDFKELLEVYNKPDVVAKALTIWVSDIATKTKKTRKQVEKKLTLDVIETIFQAVQADKIAESDIHSVMLEIVMGKEISKALKREKVEDLEEEIMKIVREKPGLSINAYMGLVMAKYKGKVNGQKIMEILKRLV